jgi:5-methylcytosine-specific restriction endonuclease McrA
MSVSAVAAGFLTSKSLVLNRCYLPVHVTTVRRAFSLLYRGAAKAVDAEYRTFDFRDWSELSTAGFDSVGLVDGVVRIPRVILLVSFDRVPRREVRFSRHNIFVRDGSRCQYCGKRKMRSQLNLDHVVPRAAGGLTSWENIVCACLDCNRRKGGRTPDQSGMTLLKQPIRPAWTPFVARNLAGSGYHEWKPFLRGIDEVYWNVELDSDD